MIAEKNALIVQDNRISQTARADQRSLMLSVYQKKFLLLLISRVNAYTKEFQKEEISFSDYCSIMNIVRGGSTYRKIEESILDICNKNFLVNTTPTKTEVFSWLEINDTEIDWDKKVIRTRLGSKLKQYYIGLSEYFTSFRLGYVINFSSKYSYRLYEFLKSYAAQKRITVPIERAYEIFCNNKYSNTTDLFRYVINKAIGEINLYSDIQVKYFSVKNKNKTTHVTFVVTGKSSETLHQLQSDWDTGTSIHMDK